METDNQQVYSTRDVYLASYLLAAGYRHYSLVQDDRQFTFVFEPETSLEALEMDVDSFWSENTAVDAKRLFVAFKELKNRMFGGGQ